MSALGQKQTWPSYGRLIPTSAHHPEHATIVTRLVTHMTEPQIWYRGSAAELYEHLLVPLIFSPHARILASRLAGTSAGDVLEIAAGTGALTRELCKVVP